MKKFILLIAVCATALTASAQKGSMAAGLNLSYGSLVSNVGFGAKYQYYITDEIRAEGGFDYFCRQSLLDMWDINVTAHYLFPMTEKMRVYPLAGFTYSNWGLQIDSDETCFDDVEESEDVKVENSRISKFGINLGAGIEFSLTDYLILNLDAKYMIVGDYNQFVPTLGVSYKF